MTMIKLKEIFKLSAPFLLSAATVISCVNGPEYERGPLETENNYGVYFPKHTNKSKIQLSPEDQKDITYTVKRTNTSDAITVPVEITESEKGIFYVSELRFDEGEDETELTIAFPKAKTDGTEYSISVDIVDPQYISLYSKKSTSISFSVSIAKWKKLTPEDGQSPAKWRDDILSSMYGGLPHPYGEAEVEVQEREDKKGLYRIKAYTTDMMLAIFGKPVMTEDKFIIVDATDPDKVWIPRQDLGLTLSPDDGAIRIASFVDKQFSIDESQNMYGKLDENGVITFPIGGIYCNLTKALGENEWIPVNSNGMLRIMLPGARLYDYSASLKNLGQEGDEMTFEIKLGRDAAKFVYKVYEGELDKGTANLYAQELAAGNGEGADGESTGNDIAISGLKTNKYTLVGYTCKADGKMQDWNYINFGFVGKGDDKTVRLTIGLEGTNEFAGQGINKDNSVKFYAYGDEITELRYWLYRADRVSEESLPKLFEKNAKKFTEQELKLINEKKFSVLLTGLNGQCDYKLMVKASNGYCEDVFEASYSTEGKFNPVMEDYTFSDFKKVHTYEYLLEKEWNFYATDNLDENPRRKLMPTKIHFKKGGTGELKLFGLSGLVMDKNEKGNSTEVGMTVTFNVQDGNFGLNFVQDALGICEAKPVTIGVMPDEQLGMSYSGESMMIIGKVEEGYMYFAPNPRYAAAPTNLTFANIVVRKGSELAHWFTEIIIADSSVDTGL